jgi:hypothetical protein
MSGSGGAEDKGAKVFDLTGLDSSDEDRDAPSAATNASTPAGGRGRGGASGGRGSGRGRGGRGGRGGGRGGKRSPDDGAADVAGDDGGLEEADGADGDAPVAKEGWWKRPLTELEDYDTSDEEEVSRIE